VGNQDEEADLKLSSSGVTNGSEVTDHKAHIPESRVKATTGKILIPKNIKRKLQ
jgi:hypothetical protein